MPKDGRGAGAANCFLEPTAATAGLLEILLGVLELLGDLEGLSASAWPATAPAAAAALRPASQATLQ